MILRPYAVVMEGTLQVGLEVEVRNGVITAIQPHTGLPDGYVLSPAFVNAHSHLEYRGFLDRIRAADYIGFLREITLLKKTQSDKEVAEDCLLAARENRVSGVARIGEHSDRPYSGTALSKVGIGGMIFQEVITLAEAEDPEEKLNLVEQKREAQSAVFPGEAVLSPHTGFTVDTPTLRQFASGRGFSIHIAEHPSENEFFESGQGPIADFYRANGFPFEVEGESSVARLSKLGLVRKGAQFVHCCDVSSDDIALMARAGVTVAHCPRSNRRLKCPPAPIRKFIDAGITVGLGLDSPASGGPIDVFAEMRAAMETSLERGEPVSPEEVWRMATDWGSASLPFSSPQGRWDIYVGSRIPLIQIAVDNAYCTEDLIEIGNRAQIGWVEALE